MVLSSVLDNLSFIIIIIKVVNTDRNYSTYSKGLEKAIKMHIQKNILNSFFPNKMTSAKCIKVSRN